MPRISHPIIRLLRTASAAFAVACSIPAFAQGFGPPVLIPTGNQPVFVASADFNADGIPDLLYIDAGATASASTTHILLGDGKGGFTQSATIATAGASVAVGDLLGKGNVDIGWIAAATVGDLQTVQACIAPGSPSASFAAPAQCIQTEIRFTGSEPVFGFLKAAKLTATGSVKIFYEYAIW